MVEHHLDFIVRIGSDPHRSRSVHQQEKRFRVMSVASPAQPSVSETVMRSYGRCVLNPKFFDRFYDRFTAKSPVIRQMFAKTEMTKQKQLLRSGISFLLQFAQGSAYAAGKVNELGASHSREKLNIKPSMYPLWLDALMETIEEFDSQFTPEARKEWLIALRRGVEKMSSLH